MDVQEREWVEEAVVDYRQNRDRAGFSISTGRNACY
jgi:hypothetical protein